MRWLDRLGRLETAYRIAQWLAAGGAVGMITTLAGAIAAVVRFPEPWSWLFVIATGVFATGVLLLVVPRGANWLAALLRKRRTRDEGPHEDPELRSLVDVGGNMEQSTLEHISTEGPPAIGLLHADGDLVGSYIGHVSMTTGVEQPRRFIPPRDDLRRDCLALAQELQVFLGEREVARPEWSPFSGHGPGMPTDAERKRMAEDFRAYSSASSKHGTETVRQYRAGYLVRVVQLDEELRNAGIGDLRSAGGWASANLAVVSDVPNRLVARALVLPATDQSSSPAISSQDQT